jgi:hypothetical protein
MTVLIIMTVAAVMFLGLMPRMSRKMVLAVKAKV